MPFSPSLVSLAIDWLINLSAGWFAASFVLPAIKQPKQPFDVGLALYNTIIALALFVLAYYIKIKAGL